MDEYGWFFKALLDERLPEKDKKEKDDKKLKQRFTIAFFVITVGEKIGEPVAICRSKFPLLFSGIKWSIATN